MGLAAALRERTRLLHVRAERTGIVREVLAGRASRQGYALLLRNLLPAYARLEAGLEEHRLAPGVRAFAQPAVYRSHALAADLEVLCGADWRSALPLLPAGARYARQVGRAARGDGARLIAHAYTRYLGDLYGGQILRRLLARSLGLGAQSLSFYDFPGIGDAEAFRAGYRTALDRAALEIADCTAVIDEAARAFELNIAVSTAVQEAASA
jgi:heme oxygenase (biliverdin-producing, ferredoxin)